MDELVDQLIPQCLNVGDEEDLDHDKLVMEALLILQERLENKSIK